MRFHLIRVLALIVGLTAVLAMTSIAAAASLSDQQISRQIEHRLSQDDALENVTVSVRKALVRLSGTVPSLLAKTMAITEARALEDVESVESDALEIERAESDLTVSEQIGKQIRRVTTPGPHGSRAGVDIREAIYGHTGSSLYGIFDYVDGWVDDGVVTLNGYVTHEYKADKMGDLVSRVQGVREIQNLIEALPVSSFDDRLRARIARQLYGNVLMPHMGIAARLHTLSSTTCASRWPAPSSRWSRSGARNTSPDRRSGCSRCRTTWKLI